MDGHGEEEENDNSSSLTSITTNTLTSRSDTSQDDQQKTSEALEEDFENENINNENKNKGLSKLDVLKIKLKRFIGAYADEIKLVKKFSSFITLCDEISVEYETRKSEADFYQQEIKELGLKLFRLETDQKKHILQVDELIKENQRVQITNEGLNKYILEAEDSQVREIGSLKARLSLMRIEKDLEKSLEGEKFFSKVKIKKKTRFPFFFRKKHSHTLNSPSTFSSSIEKTENQLKLKLEKMFIEIESFKKACHDFQKKEDLLESELQTKDIEINKKQQRLKELTKKLLQVKQVNVVCQELIEAAEVKVIQTTTIIKNIEADIKERNRDINSTCKKLQRLQFCIDGVNEENKKLLNKLNTITFELCNERLKSNLFFGKLMTFTRMIPNNSGFPRSVTCSGCNEPAQVLDDFFKEQIEASKKSLADLISYKEIHKNKKVTEVESQTEITIKCYSGLHVTKMFTDLTANQTGLLIDDFSVVPAETVSMRTKKKDDRTPTFFNNELKSKFPLSLHAQRREIQAHEKEAIGNYKNVSTVVFVANTEKNPDDIENTGQEIHHHQINHHHQKEMSLLLTNGIRPKESLASENLKAKISKNELGNKTRNQCFRSLQKPSGFLELNPKFTTLDTTTEFMQERSTHSSKLISALIPKTKENSLKFIKDDLSSSLNNFSNTEDKKRNLFLQHYKEGAASINKILVKKANIEKIVEQSRLVSKNSL